MKKIPYILFAGLLFAGSVFAAPSTTIVNYLKIGSTAGGGTLCLHVDNTGLVSVAAADCGTGGGGSTTINGLNTTSYTFVGAGGLTIATSAPGTITFTQGAGSGNFTTTTINTVSSTAYTFLGTTNQITIASSGSQFTWSIPTDPVLPGTTTVGHLKFDTFTGHTLPMQIYANGDTDTGIHFPGPDILAFHTAGSDRLLINALGNIGIGTTTPISPFYVYGTSTFVGSSTFQNGQVLISVASSTGNSASQSGGLFLNNTANPGIGANFYSNYGAGQLTSLVFMKQDNSAATVPVLRIDNDGTNSAMVINNNNTSATTQALSIVNAAPRNGIKITQRGVSGTGLSSTGGSLLIDKSAAKTLGLNIYSTNPDPEDFITAYSAPSSTLVNVAQQMTTTSTVLTVDDTSGFPSSGTLTLINDTSYTENGDTAFLHYTTTTATTFVGTAGAFYTATAPINLIDNSLVFYNDQSSTYSMINTAAIGSNGGKVNLKLLDGNPDIEFVSLGGYDSSIGEGKFEIDVPSGDSVVENSTDVIRINGRADANNQYQPIMVLTRPGVTRQGLVGIGFQNRTSPVNLTAHFHVVNDTFLGDTNAPALVVSKFQGATGQTADLMQWAQNSSTISSVVNNLGYFGIGTTTPSNALSVVGNIQIASSTAGLIFGDGTTQVTANNYPNFNTTTSINGLTGAITGLNIYNTTTTLAAGAGITVTNGGIGNTTVTNNGVLAITAGTGISVNNATGTVTITNTGSSVSASTTLARFTAQSNVAPSSSFATFDLRNDHPVLDFTSTSMEYATFGDVMPQNYVTTTNAQVVTYWTSTSTTGVLVAMADFERIGDGAQDIDTDGYAASSTASTTVSGTSGNTFTITFNMSNANLDGVLAGEPFRLRIGRTKNSIEDTIEDAELNFIKIIQ